MTNKYSKEVNRKNEKVSSQFNVGNEVCQFTFAKTRFVFEREIEKSKIHKTVWQSKSSIENNIAYTHMSIDANEDGSDVKTCI